MKQSHESHFRSARNPAGPNSATVLVVDDEPITRSMLAWMLNRQGYKVLLAEDGAQAMAISRIPRSERLSFLITDLRPSGTDGIALAAQLRVALPELKALFVSGMSPEAMAKLGADLSHFAFLAKPFNARQLDAALRALAEQKTSLY